MSSASVDLVLRRLTLHLLVVSASLHCSFSELHADLGGQTSFIMGIKGERGELPCGKLTTGELQRSVFLVLWFREGAEVPFYTFDIRKGHLVDAATSQKKPNMPDMPTNDLKTRSFFSSTSNPTALLIDALRESDEGVYVCRVDYKDSPTTYSFVNLTVIVPPQRPWIVDEVGNPVGTLIGPYKEDDVISLTCSTSGGKPRPSLFWYKGGTLIDDPSIIPTISFTRNAEDVSNHLDFGPLDRTDLHSVLTCIASNNNISAPESTAVIIDMYLKPSQVEILGLNQPYSSGKPYKISCQSSGSRPPAVISWWLAGRQLIADEETININENVTTSHLTFIPTPGDHGHDLICRARNTKVEDSAIDASRELTVYFKPEVALEFGPNLNPDNIKAGDDVYFECKMSARPAPYRVFFTHNGFEVRENRSIGILTTEESLVLRGVTRSLGGTYRCHAHNLEGKTTSAPAQLFVKYPPSCKPNQKLVYGVSIGEEVTLSCELEAEPDQVEFKWAFNSTPHILTMPSSRVVDQRTQSFLTYTPESESDYGTFLCWGQNDIGEQKNPCVFHVLQTGPPDPPVGCHLFNQTSTSFVVECREGFDGGLPQVFVMEIYAQDTRRLALNMSSVVPKMTARGLKDGESYSVVIYSTNAKGDSTTISLQAQTPITADVRKLDAGLASTEISRMTPVLGGLIGVIVAIVLISVVVVYCVRCRGSSEARNSSSPNNCQNKKNSEPELSLNADAVKLESFFNSRKSNPDQGGSSGHMMDVSRSHADDPQGRMEVPAASCNGSAGGTVYTFPQSLKKPGLNSYTRGNVHEDVIAGMTDLDRDGGRFMQLGTPMEDDVDLDRRSIYTNNSSSRNSGVTVLERCHAPNRVTSPGTLQSAELVNRLMKTVLHTSDGSTPAVRGVPNDHGYIRDKGQRSGGVMNRGPAAAFFHRVTGNGTSSIDDRESIV